MAKNTDHEAESITVAEFREMLSVFDDDDVLYFSGLDFYRLKMRGGKTVQVEFNQLVYRNGEGRVVVENLE